MRYQVDVLRTRATHSDDSFLASPLGSTVRACVHHQKKKPQGHDQLREEALIATVMRMLTSPVRAAIAVSTSCWLQQTASVPVSL
jgi:hypothetical protein